MKRIASVLVLGIAMVVGGLLASAADQTLTGVVTDATCGAGAHKNPNNPKGCTNACARSGGYALIVGSKVYKLEGKTEGLADLAADKAKVTGAVDEAGMKITVTSVAKGS